MPREPAPAAPEAPPLAFEEATLALSVANSREEIGEAVVRYGRGRLDHVMLFLVRDGMALGWKGAGAGVDPAMVELIMLPLNAPSMFQEAAEGRLPYAGPVSDAVLHRHFYKALKRDAPASVAVVPVVMKDRTVNLVYGDLMQREDVGDALPQLVEIATHVAAAYERLVRDYKRRLESR